jgi:hypothetical protein
MKGLSALLLVSLLLISAKAFADDPLSFNKLYETDLTGPFHTKTKWQFVITQHGDPDDPEDLNFCFVGERGTKCTRIAAKNCDLIEGKSVGSRKACMDVGLYLAILGRFGLWKIGDPPPIPPAMTNLCGKLEIDGHVEWCH